MGYLQVLGGAGPAIAAVPLTVVWAGGSAVTLLSSLGQGKVGPFGAVQRVGFTLSMAFAQVTCLLDRQEFQWPHHTQRHPPQSIAQPTQSYHKDWRGLRAGL